MARGPRLEDFFESPETSTVGENEPGCWSFSDDSEVEVEVCDSSAGSEAPPLTMSGLPPPWPHCSGYLPPLEVPLVGPVLTRWKLLVDELLEPGRCHVIENGLVLDSCDYCDNVRPAAVLMA